MKKTQKKILRVLVKSILYVLGFFIFCAACSYFEWSINEFKSSEYFKKGYYQTMTISDISDYCSWVFQLPLRNSVTPKMIHFFELGNVPYQGMPSFVLSLVFWFFLSIPTLILLSLGFHIYNTVFEYLQESETNVVENREYKN